MLRPWEWGQKRFGEQMTKKQLRKIHKIRKAILTYLDEKKWEHNRGASTLLDCGDDILRRKNEIRN